MATRPEVTVELKLDTRPFVETLRQLAAAFEPLAQAMRQVADMLDPPIPGLQQLARASDLTIAQRRGEEPCTGVHDALASSGCPFCRATL